MSRCRPSGSCLETPSGRDRSCLVAKGLLMILRAAVSARSGRATTYSETGPYRHQRYRYHQISQRPGRTAWGDNECIMPHLLQLRTGWEGERLAAYLLSQFSFIAHPASVADDLGSDFFCTIFEVQPVAGRQALLPRSSFAI